LKEKAEFSFGVKLNTWMFSTAPTKQWSAQNGISAKADSSSPNAKRWQLLTFLFWRWLDGFVGRLTEGRDRLTQQP
jgi:hypothetical protein